MNNEPETGLPCVRPFGDVSGMICSIAFFGNSAKLTLMARLGALRIRVILLIRFGSATSEASLSGLIS